MTIEYGTKIAPIYLELALKILRITIATKEEYDDWEVLKYTLKQIEVFLSSGLKYFNGKGGMKGNEASKSQGNPN